MRPGQLQPNDFEIAILGRIAAREPSIRDFVKRLHVLSREFTGSGSFTTFRCEESSPVADEATRPIGLHALIRLSSVPNGLGAVLFCNGNKPECLEVYTYGGEHWDGVYEGFAIEEAAAGPD